MFRKCQICYSHFTKVTRKCECFGRIVEPWTTFLFQFSFASEQLRRTIIETLATNNYQRLKIVHIFRWILCLFSSMETIQKKQELIEWPFITLHGDEDKMCDVVGSQKFFDSAKSKDKEIKVSAGLKINTSKQLKFWFAFILLVVKNNY